MHLKSLHIKKLFSQFSYDIDFKDTIKIITGPNGYGKTTLLKMISNVTNLNFYYFFQIPFVEIVFNFEKDFKVTISKKSSFYSIIEEFDLGDESDLLIDDKIFVSFNDDKETVIVQKDIDSGFEKLGFTKIKEDIWINASGDRYYFTSELIEENRYVIESNFQENKENLMILSGMKVGFIQDQRLFSSVFETVLNGKTYIHINNFEIDNCSKKLKDYLSEIKSDFSKKFQESQSIIITKINQNSNVDIPDSEFLKRANELNYKFRRAFTFGICEKIEIPVVIPDTNKNFLFVALQEYENVIHAFVNEIEKIELFAKLITDSDFPYKSIEIKDGFGFKFIDKNGQFIANKVLSSGEQHRVITFYNLVFKTYNNMILLIDEPELSNHVVWQLSFLKDIKQVIKKKQIQTIIATHSPQIIDGKWELTSDLYKIRK